MDCGALTFMPMYSQSTQFRSQVGSASKARWFKKTEPRCTALAALCHRSCTAALVEPGAERSGSSTGAREMAWLKGGGERAAQHQGQGCPHVRVRARAQPPAPAPGSRTPTLSVFRSRDQPSRAPRPPALSPARPSRLVARPARPLASKARPQPTGRPPPDSPARPCARPKR